MRRINWHKFKNSNTLHVRVVNNISLWAYDSTGKLYKEIYDPSQDLPLIVWVECRLTCPYSSWSWSFSNMAFAMKEDAYCFGWYGKRLSSLPEHEYQWRHQLWITNADRNFIVEHFTYGIQ